MRYFCTYFDQHYLPRGLALYRSLRLFCPEFLLWALCMDDEAYQILTDLSLPGLHPISIDEFEQNDEPLRSTKLSRSKIEYYFTCTPSLPLFILNNWDEVDLVTYLDADLFFFADPSPLFEELSTSSIAIIAHRFPSNLQYLTVHGIYNVGWLSFRRDVNGLACLNWWRDRCIEWCYDRLEDTRFADQKYLDDWPSRFEGVCVLKHKGANLAPWNVRNYSLSLDSEHVLVDGEPLVFFHFHGMKRVFFSLYDTNLYPYGVKLSRLLRGFVFRPYIRMLIDAHETIVRYTNASLSKGIRVSEQARGRIPFIQRSLDRVRAIREVSRRLVGGNYLIQIKKHVI